MENSIRINSSKLPIREYNGQRVVTFKEIDTVHGRPEGTARKRFNDNKERFISGVDYFKISPSEFRTAIGEMDFRQQNDITLMTESGYLMLAKSFTDDLAWKVQRELVNNYFHVKTPEPEQLTLETSEYHYFPKTHRGEPVITTADFAHFTGINIDAARCFVKRYCKLGTDYYLLEREALADFKMENPEMRRMCGALIVMTKSAVDKLVKYYNCVDKVPKLPEVRKIEPPAVEVEPSTTSLGPKYVTTDEAIVALEVLRFIKNMSENHRQEYDASGDKRMVKRCTEDISAIGKAIKTVGMLVAAGY